MKHSIGETAGKLWEKLKTSGEMNMANIPKSMDATAALVNQAIGWLAREDKIEFRMEKGKTFIRLSEK